MMSQRAISDLFARKVPLSKCEELIDEVLTIAYNKAEPTLVRDKKGEPVLMKGVPFFEDNRPYTATNQLAAIRMITEFAIGKPIAEADDTEQKQPSVVVILPSNGR